MSTLLKILIALGVVLPLAGFVAGSLVAASDQSPTRERIIIQDDSTPTGPEKTGDPRREKDPARKQHTDDSDPVDTDEDDDLDDDTDDGVRGGGVQDDERDDDTSTSTSTSRGGDDDTRG